MNKTGAYDLMRREYVEAPQEQETEFTLSKIARRYNRSPSSVARMSRLEHWMEQRAIFRGGVAEVTTELAADTYAGKLVEIHASFIRVAEKTLVAYEKGVDNGDITPSAGDVEKMVKLVREIVNRPRGGEETSGAPALPGLNLSPELARDFISRLEGLARERLVSTAGTRDPVVVSDPEGEGRRLRVR
jgi:hypothetical protein